MKKKEYLKPAMRVVKIQHTGMLMTSGFGAGRRSYGTANDGVDNTSWTATATGAGTKTRRRTK